MSIYDDLNRSLFLQLDKLQDCDPEDIENEIERSKQVANLAGGHRQPERRAQPRQVRGIAGHDPAGDTRQPAEGDR